MLAGSILSIEDATAGSVTMTAPFNRRTGRHVLGKVRTVQYSTVQYSAVQYSTVQYSTVQYSTVQCSTVQCSTVQYSAVHYTGCPAKLFTLGYLLFCGLLLMQTAKMGHF